MCRWSSEASGALFASLVVLTLTVGIGATMAVFNVVYSVLLAPPPYPDSDRLLFLAERGRTGENDGIGYLTFDDIRRETALFSSLAAASYWMPVARSETDVRQLTGVRVSQEYFRTLGVRPALGRDFAPEEDTQATRTVVLLSHSLWTTLYGGDTAIVGTSTIINGVSYLVAGVMPAGFRDPLTPEAVIWAPLGYERELPFACRTCHHLRVVGRLRPRITREEAGQQLDRYLETLRSRYPDQYGSVGAYLRTLQQEMTGPLRPALLGLLGAVGLLLLLAGINVGNLFLGRAGERQADLMVRMALGANRRSLVGLVSLEAAVLSLVGGGLGALAGWAGTRALLRLEAIPVAIADRVDFAGPLIGVALGLTVLSLVIGGSLPAALALRETAFEDIRIGGRALGGRLRHRLRHGVVIAEVGLAVMLLTGAGLQVRSLRHLLAVQTGFDPENVMTLGVSLTGPRYQEEGSAWAFDRQWLEASRGMAGVEAAAVVSQIPLGGNYDAYGLQREDRPLPNPADAPAAQRFAIGPEYLDAMQIPVLRGRGFTEGDREGTLPVALLNRSGASRIFGPDDPIGRRIRFGDPDGPWRTIVGIVEDVRHLSLDGEVESQFYVPFDQNPFEEAGMMAVVRVTGKPETVAAGLVASIRRLDPGAAVSRPRSMHEVIGGKTATRRLALSLIGGFAAIAVVLALSGLYGVMAASVIERTREIGVRSALGATPGHLISMVARRGLLLTLAGVGLGIAGILTSGRALARFVAGVSSADPITLAGVTILIALVAMLACLLPALRASRVDPLIALRD